MRPLGPPSREIVFRVRVVRDVRAKLCARYPGGRVLARKPCLTPLLLRGAGKVCFAKQEFVFVFFLDQQICFFPLTKRSL